MEAERAISPSPHGLPFFQVGLAKFAVMSLFTFGLYELFWSYKQWDAFGRRTGTKVNGWLRTIVAMPLFFFPLFRDISRTVAAMSSVRLRAPTLLAVCFVVILVVAFVPSWLSVLSALAVVPLLVVQRQINACHRELGFDPKQNSRLSPLNVLGVACGVVGYGMWLWPWIKWFVATRLAA
jgi:hypothetical protein